MAQIRSDRSQIEGALYELLRDRLPICRAANGRLDIARLSDLLGMSKEGVYHWLRSNFVSRSGRRKLITLSASATNIALMDSNKPLSAEDFVRFY